MSNLHDILWLVFYMHIVCYWTNVFCM